ncbi:hypothetical protein TNCV_2019901 [Trichonephila clavipes]|nr:hypothetical protein TNCV_2019901 [Trichonephila clavipes]
MGVKDSTRNGRCDPKCPSSAAIQTQGPLVKVLPVPGWRPMKQLAVHVHFLRCGGLLDDWSVESVVMPGLHADDICRIYWSKHLLTTQSERPN